MIRNELLVLAFLVLASCELNTTPPEKAAGEFAARLGMQLLGAPTCAALDTDCDDYVTCTVNERTGDSARLVSVQCAALDVAVQCIRGPAQGCKLTRANGDTK